MYKPYMLLQNSYFCINVSHCYTSGLNKTNFFLVHLMMFHFVELALCLAEHHGNVGSISEICWFN